ncbi:MAG: DEAD/DEAH box helicase family protein [Alphaproteobacteria bacterium]|nr:DEAD/DEAH box helicase family protein [Alphaproteobacteria bacterium]MDA7989657.1 DEAD/DEAH box helicase family protein [Gammaproteobacteria bacterium]
MGLREILLKGQYDSITDDVYGSFFNRILSNSTRYDRIGGRFTSKNLAACAQGLQGFIQRDGTMRLMLLPEFSQDDIDSINRGTRDIESVISEGWIRDLAEISEKFVEDHTKALAWMLAHEYLEIKIVVPVDKDGHVSPECMESHMFGTKTGLFTDGTDHVSFSGTIEFDDPKFGEYQHFRVYREWMGGEKEYFDRDYEEFHNCWGRNQTSQGVTLRTIPLPSAVRESMIRIAPASKSDIVLQRPPELRPYQREAAKKWAESDHRGILEMATGTGKTFTAIGCMIGALKDGGPTLVVIVCPSDNLERQWQKELEKWGYESTITSGDTKWAQKLQGQIAALQLGKTDMLAVITTYKTFSSERFTREMTKCSVRTMLVADEVHNAGSPMHSRGLVDNYDLRLGLSATVDRYYDDPGTATIKGFFGETVYEISLKRAINEGFLVGYHYHPIYGDLNAEEYERYQKLTKKIAYLWSLREPKDKEELEEALLMRSRIIRDAESKIARFAEWLRSHSDNSRYLLAYCSERQIPEIKNILNTSDRTYSEITSKHPKNPLDRGPIIKEFEDGRIDMIIANKVLDEGADMPAAKNCIILSSTGNPKQFIQRRGRVLRKYGGTYRDGSTKEHASIFDVLIMPDIPDSYTEAEKKTERQIVISQISRQIEMADAAINRIECMTEICKLAKKFSIPIDSSGRVNWEIIKNERENKSHIKSES